MANDILTLVMKGIMPYVAPIVFILGAIAIATELIGLIKGAFVLKGRRNEY